MSYNNNQRSITLEANADLSSHQYKIVELLSDHKCDIADLRAGFGVLQNAPQSGEAGTVCVDGETKVKAGGTIAVGNHIHCVASGGWAGRSRSRSSGGTPYRLKGLRSSLRGDGVGMRVEANLPQP